MKPALVDVSVLILFFNRPKLLAQVFEQVKKARPARLFLYQTTRAASVTCRA